jgi:mRNA interferase MazF
MVKKWSIYWTSLDPTIGSEQAGMRPSLIISNDIVNEVLPVVTVLPLSSIKKSNRIYPTEVFLPRELSLLPKDSVIMIHKIRTISKERIGPKCGDINNEKIRSNIKDVLRQYFEL